MAGRRRQAATIWPPEDFQTTQLRAWGTLARGSIEALERLLAQQAGPTRAGAGAGVDEASDAHAVLAKDERAYLEMAARFLAHAREGAVLLSTGVGLSSPEESVRKYAVCLDALEKGSTPTEPARGVGLLEPLQAALGADLGAGVGGTAALPATAAGIVLVNEFFVRLRTNMDRVVQKARREARLGF